MKTKSGKTTFVWAFEDPSSSTFYILHSIFFQLEWPPKSGQMQEFPENDRGEFFSIEIARKKILPSQAEFLERLVGKIEGRI